MPRVCIGWQSRIAFCLPGLPFKDWIASATRMPVDGQKHPGPRFPRQISCCDLSNQKCAPNGEPDLLLFPIPQSPPGDLYRSPSALNRHTPTGSASGALTGTSFRLHCRIFAENSSTQLSGVTSRQNETQSIQFCSSLERHRRAVYPPSRDERRTPPLLFRAAPKILKTLALPYP
jgi:hypothetical protein